jgi:predicted enzyme related to lactoylglutathione lyase
MVRFVFHKGFIKGVTLLGMDKITHFEMGVENFERARGFYEKVFGWKFTEWKGGDSEYWMIETMDKKSPGAINGGMMKRMNPEMRIVNTIEVDDIDMTLGAVVANKGSIVFPKKEIPEMGWMAYFKDVEGNIFGVMQRANKK